MGNFKVAVVKRAPELSRALFTPESGVLRHYMPIFYAGDNGFEPLLTVPETAVLPLDESPILFLLRSLFYHARRDETRLFPRGAAGVVFHVH